MDETDLQLLRACAYKINERLTNKAFNNLPLVFPSANIESLKKTEGRVQFLSGFQPVRYDCCINSCIRFTGAYEDLPACPICADPRRDEKGAARAYFQYLPIIPRLRAMLVNRACAPARPQPGLSRAKR
jgi:hypothetical protein